MTDTMIRAILLLASLILAAVDAAPQEVTALLGGSLIDGKGGPPLPDAVVLVQGERIRAVGRRGELAVPEGARRIELAGSTLLPGLIDAHVHFGQSGALTTRPDVLNLRGTQTFWENAAIGEKTPERYFKAFLCSGVTSIVDVGDPLWMIDIRNRSQVNEQAPRIATAGPLLSTVPFVLDPEERMMEKLSTEDEAREKVRSQAARRPDLIKFWFIVPGGDFDYPAAERAVATAIAEARRLGVRVAVHATGLREAKDAVKSGANLLVHSVGDRPVDEEFIELLKKNNVVYTPNLVVLESYVDLARRRPSLERYSLECADPEIVRSFEELPLVPEEKFSERSRHRASGWPEQKMILFENLRRIHSAGVTIAAGTDAGNTMTLHGVSMAREIELMIEAGLSPMEAIVAATRGSARAFGSGEIGIIEKGKLAELIAVRGDPLREPGALKRVLFVMKAGKIVKHELAGGRGLPLPRAACASHGPDNQASQHKHQHDQSPPKESRMRFSEGSIRRAVGRVDFLLSQSPFG